MAASEPGTPLDALRPHRELRQVNLLVIRMENQFPGGVELPLLVLDVGRELQAIAAVGRLCRHRVQLQRAGLDEGRVGIGLDADLLMFSPGR